MASGDLNSKVTTVIVLKPNSPTTDQLIQVLSANVGVEVIQVDTAQEVVQLTSQMQPCIVITSVVDSKAVVNIMGMLKGIFPLAKRGRIKSLLISAIKSSQIRTAAQKLMVSEFIEEPISPRTLQFKSNLLVKAIDSIKKRDAELKSQSETISIKQGEVAKAKEAYAQEAKMKPALNLEADAFTFRGAKVKKQDNRTQFNLGGPDPASGEWKEHKSAEEGKTQWRWVPTDPKELEKIGGSDGKDGWLADGEKPEFDALKKKWQFAGPKPGLANYKDGRKEAVKAEINAQGELEVAEDSPIAEEKVKKSLDAIAKRAESQERGKPDKPHGEKAETEKKEEPKKEIPEAKDKTKDNADKLAKLRQLGEDTEAASSPDSPKALREEKAKRQSGLAQNAGEEAPSQEVKAAKEKEKTNNADRLAKLRGQIGKPGQDPEEDTGLDATNTIPGDETSSGLNDKTQKDAAGKTKPPRDLSRLRASLEDDEEEDSESAANPEAGKARREKKSADGESPAAEEQAGGRKKNAESDKKLSAAERLAAFKNRLGDMDEEPDAESSHGKLDKGQDPAAKRKAREIGDKTQNAAEDPERKKREIKNEIQNELNAPIPEKLGAAEREKLEQETGTPKGQLNDKELAKKAKLARLKNLKKKLMDADLEIGAGSDDADGKKRKENIHDLNPGKAENKSSRSQSNFEELKAKWSAQDSDQDEKDVEWQGKKSKSLEPAKIEAASEDGREVFYVTKDELATKQPAWERTESYYVCIGAENRYRGFKTLEELLPIWSFKGDEKPEYLEKQKQWRFYDKAPVRHDSVADIPLEISDYLLSLNQQIASNTKKASKGEGDQLELLAKKLQEKKSRMDSLRAEVLNDDENKQDGEESSLGVAERKRQKQDKVKADLEALQNEMAEMEREKTEREEARAKALESIAADTLEESQEREKQEKDYRDQVNENLADKGPEKQPAEENLYGDAAEAKPEKSEADSKMDALRAKLDISDEEPEAAPVISAVDDLANKVHSNEALEFLKKRKEKLADMDPAENKTIGRAHREAISAQKEIKPTSTAQIRLGDAIGVSLLISDALFDGKNLIDTPANLLKTISDRFGSCAATIIDNIDDKKGRVLGTQNERHPLGQELAASNIGQGESLERICVPAQHSKTKKILGFIVIDIVDPRKNFDSSDLRILQAIAHVVGDYWTHMHEKTKTGKAA